MKIRGYFPYRPAAVLRARGGDVFSFLQGQFTQDLRSNSERLCAYGLWLNQKGKVVADSFALRQGEEWLLVSTSSSASTIRERLEAYIIADDVELSDETERWAGWTFLGGGVDFWLASHGVALPLEGAWLPVEDGLVFRGRKAAAPNWEWLRPISAGAPADLSELKALDFADLERRRIEAGIPKIPVDIGPHDLPQEGRLDRDAISYSKGCYLGQEVMARLHHQGQVRRNLLRVSGPGLPVAGSALLNREGKKVGELRSAAPTSDGSGFVGLAMVSRLGLDPERRLTLEGSASAAVELAEEGG